MAGLIHTDISSRSPLLFNLNPSFSAETLKLHSEPDTSTITNYTDDAFSRFIVTDLTVVGGHLLGGYDKGFSIQPNTGYTAVISINAGTGATLGDVSSSVTLNGSTSDRIERNGGTGEYTLIQDGVQTKGGVRKAGSSHTVSINSVIVQEVEDEEEEEEETVTVVTQPSSIGGLPMAAKIGIPVAILAVLLLAMKK